MKSHQTTVHGSSENMKQNTYETKEKYVHAHLSETAESWRQWGKLERRQREKHIVYKGAKIKITVGWWSGITGGENTGEWKIYNVGERKSPRFLHPAILSIKSEVKTKDILMEFIIGRHAQQKKLKVVLSPKADDISQKLEFT